MTLPTDFRYTSKLDDVYIVELFKFLMSHPYGLPDYLRSIDHFYHYINQDFIKKVVVPYGIYYMSINDPQVAVGHCVFFDKKVIGRAKDLNFITKWAIEKFKLSRIESYIPPENLSANYLLDKAGYHYEGTLHLRVFYNGMLNDVNVWGYIHDNFR